jgi:AcrR family transcriptional regulator
MEPSRRIRKKSGYHHGDLRRTLVQAALQVVDTQGAAAVTLREVARMAGVSHQAPYRYFQDRTDLLATVAEEGLRMLHAELVEQTRLAPDSSAALRAIAIAYVGFAVKNPARFRIMYGAEAASFHDRPSLAAASDAIFNLLTGTIAEVQRTLASDVDTLDYALSAWSMVHGLAMLLIDQQLTRRAFAGRPPRDLTMLVTSTLRHGLETRPAKPPR